VPSLIKIQDKKFFSQKKAKGVSLQNFWGPKKKKNLFYKTCSQWSPEFMPMLGLTLTCTVGWQI
jgi:hypothetical protein